MSAEEQITFLDQIRDAHEWKNERIWELDEKLYSKMKDQMNEYVDDMETAYKGMQDDINSRTDSIVNGLQAQIDALDDEGTADDRESATQDHNEKIAQLQKDKHYEELRTGAEHRAKVVEIDKQIADENRDFQKTQADWVRDDKKDALQGQIQDAKDAGQTELDNLKKNYDKAKNITETSMSKIIASINAQGDSWKAAGKSLIDSLITGLQTGDFSSVLDQIASISGNSSGQSDSAQGAINKVKTGVAPASSATQSTTTVSDWFTKEIAYLTGLKKTGDVGQKTWANQLLYYVNLAKDGDSGQKAWARSQASGMGVTIPQADIGAYVTQDGIAKVHHDERIMSPNLTVSFDRLASAIVGNPRKVENITGGGSGDFDRAADRIIAAIERKAGAKIGNLVHIDNYNPDVVDANILAREMQREIERVG